MFKLLITIVVIAALGAGLWYSGYLTKIIDMIPLPQAATTATTTPQTSGVAQAPQSDLPTSETDASDAALAQDSAAIDVQMQGLSSDSASAQSSMSDTPVSQGY